MDRVIIIKTADNLYPIQVDMSDDQFEGRRNDNNIPQKIRHKKRFRNEFQGLEEQDMEGRDGTKNQFRGMGTDNSYDTNMGVGGQALGY